MDKQKLPLKYRKDIDGLRAIAVSAVILYHAFPKFIPGGFIGVDIFFVISGFLISSILFKNLENNNYTLYDFYARRIKRIFPALILVLSFCIGLGWFVLTAEEYTQIATHAMASTTFYTNFVLAREAGYFDVSAHAKPLMHLWSLAVEEQFYIFWPLLLYLVTKKRTNILLFCVGITLLSFFTSLKVLTKAPIKAFYFPLYRAWELASGALLAYFTHCKIKTNANFGKYTNSILRNIFNKTTTSHRKHLLNNSLSILGFLINFCCIISLKKTISFPGWYAILPVTGTILIIAAGEAAWVNRIILSNKVCVWVGLISYPLYLWHWPLLSFTNILNGQSPNFRVVIIIIFISFILSWLTYKFIEQPIRHAKENKLLVLVLVSILAVIWFFAYKIEVNNGYRFRKAHITNGFSNVELEVTNIINNTFVPCSSLLKTNSTEFDYPACGINSNNPKFLVIGDSHAFCFTESIAVFNSLEVVMMYLIGHPPSLNYLSYNPADHIREQRIQQQALYKKYLNTLIDSYGSVKYVILVSRGPLYTSGTGYGIEEKHYSNSNKWKLEKILASEGSSSNKEAFVEGYVEMIKFLISKGKKVIFVIDYPELGIDPASCFKRPFSFSQKNEVDCLLRREDVDNRQREYRELVKKITEQAPSLMVYDPIEAFCDQSKCYGKRNGIIYYRDNNHLNIAGSKLLIEHFKKWLKDHEGI